MMKNRSFDRVDVMQGDITTLRLDAIVNAANPSLLGGGGVDGAIHRAAGPELLSECRKLGGCSTGMAKITNGYNLPVKYVIHAVGPVYRGSDEDRRLLSLCYVNSLKLAVENHITSIAFPAISCGAYGYPIKEACSIAIDTTFNFLETNRTLKKVVFILFSTQNFDVYKKYLKNSVQNH